MGAKRAVVAGWLLAALAGAAGAADPPKSGPQVGDEVPGSFRPLNVNGPDAGERSCLYCRNGLNPVVMVFARRADEPLAGLIADLDAAAAKHAGAKLGAFVVFLGGRDKLEPDLAALDKRLALKHVVLAVEAPPGPEKYAVAREADVTVVLYSGNVVKANRAFRKGEFDAKAAAAVLADLPAILPAK